VRNQLKVVCDKENILLHHDARVKKIIPHAEVVRSKYLKIPIGIDELILLRNLGYDAPTPIESIYDFCGTTPFEHQKKTASLLTTNRRAYVLSDMGTGKTLSVLYALDFLIKIKRARKALVVAPLSTLGHVWAREVMHWMPHLRTSILHGTRKQRLAALQVPADLYVINHDGVKTISKELYAAGFDVVIIDELARYRNRRTDRWKQLQPLVIASSYAWGLTGRPVPNAPTDAWAQAKLLTPGSVPDSFMRFREQTMYPAGPFKWLPRRDSGRVVHAALQPAIRYSLEDCIDLPPVTYTSLEVCMSQEQEQIYKKMLRHYHAVWKGGEVTAANAGVMTSKLLQIASGFAYDAQGRAIPIQQEGTRFTVLEELLEAASGKVLVFAPFIHLVERLGERLAKAGVSIASVHGATNKNRRTEIFQQFQDTDYPQVIVAHPAVLAHGLTLTRANTVVWYAPPPSAEIHEQANRRIRRPGQTSHQHIIYLTGSSIETKLYKYTFARDSYHSALLELFQEDLDGDS
jgi:SNF2 family DNA or RNA helicase